jgi:hypothetical protein
MQATNYGIGFEREMFSKMPTKVKSPTLLHAQ